MAVEIVHFLMGRFTDGLRGEDNTTEILFHERFRELNWELEKRIISSTTPPDTTNLLRELLYDLHDLLVECRTRSRRRSADVGRQGRRGACLGCYCPGHLWFCYRTKRRLRRIMRSVRTISRAAGETGAGKGKATEFDRWSYPAVGMCRIIHGRLSEQALEMEKLLVEQGGGRGFTAVGVLGMGGVGKTTLAQAVFNSPGVKRHFRPRLWVCMSPTAERGRDTRKETLERMLMSLGVDEEVIGSASDGKSGGESLAVLAFMLHLQLMGKRYLIVFDDMWSTDGWYQGLMDGGSPRDADWGDRLAYGLPKGGGGGAVVTGRLEAAVKGMVGEEGDTRRLLPSDVSGEACWSIFMDAFAKGSPAVDDPVLRAMEVEITNKCSGLPLAARTMGGILSEIISTSSGGVSSRGSSSSYVSANSGILE